MLIRQTFTGAPPFLAVQNVSERMAFTEVREFQRDVDLTDTAPWNPLNEYTIVVEDGSVLTATLRGTGGIFFEPSCSSRFFGCIKHDQKDKWEYRIKGDCGNKPPTFEDAVYPVLRIIERVRRVVTVA